MLTRGVSDGFFLIGGISVSDLGEVVQEIRLEERPCPRKAIHLL